MKKGINILLGTAVLSFFLTMPVLAQQESTPSVSELIRTLQQQVEQLRVQIQAIIAQMETVRQAKGEIKETAAEVKTTLRLIRQLSFGMTGEDVKLLQEILATDSDVYPEGLVTGYFGSLTRNAVKRFQKIAGIEQVGLVGPKTMTRINELLEQGAGKSGKVPPGLLIAPGIRKKLGFEPQPLPGQKLPPGIAKKLTGETPAQDVTPPMISEITVADITATSAKISWITNEKADSRVWYDISTPLVVTDTTPVATNSDLVLNHQVSLSGLTPDTAYYFIVNSTDGADNNEISEEKTFTTLKQLTEIEQACINSGGQVVTLSCCLATSDFPNLCLVGACGCSAEDSHEVKTCDCGTGKCFNGSECVAVQ